jgi:hypothetical protein
LTIDIATGQILNWKRPTNYDLVSTFGACANVPLKKIVKNTLYGKLGSSVKYKRGSIKVKGEHFNSIQDAVTFKSSSANSSHLRLRRDTQGHFIKMDDIIEFIYTHKVTGGYGEGQWRQVKVVKEVNNTIEGIQCNGTNTGYKCFNKSKMVDVYRYKGYIKS